MAKTTSIQISKDLHWELKRIAATQRMSIRDATETALRQWFAGVAA